MINRIALTGYAKAGKDTAAEALFQYGYQRRCFGDIIKRQLDSLVQAHLGFSAFTSDPQEKAQIRHVLEHWGDANYDSITEEYFADLPYKAVNTRLVRSREARQWIDRGGVVIEVHRPGFAACSQWEADNLQELYREKLIHGVIVNGGDVSELHQEMLKIAEVT
jgi:hypothetical protein